MCSRRPTAYHTQSSERFKVVTLDGTLINKAGLITGGSSPQEKSFDLNLCLSARVSALATGSRSARSS